MTQEAPVVCRLDLVPATVTITSAGVSNTYEQTRVIVTADRIYVFHDGAPPYILFEERIDSFEGRNTVGYTVYTASGTRLNFKRGGGCACGSQLRSFRPFPQGLVQGPYNIT